MIGFVSRLGAGKMEAGEKPRVKLHMCLAVSSADGFTSSSVTRDNNRTYSSPGWRLNEIMNAKHFI